MKTTIWMLVAGFVLFTTGCSDAQSDKKGGDLVQISTSYGNIKVKLYDETPEHKKNFLKLAGEGYYDDLLFHRVMNEFMIQGGDPQSKAAPAGAPLGNSGPGYTVPANFQPALYHKKGALAAARQPDQVNPEKESSGSQFYIVQGRTWTDTELDQIEQRIGYEYTEEQREMYRTVGGTPFLDGNYTVFGEVVDGLDVIDKIAVVQTDGRNRPLKDVAMKMKIVKK